MAFRPEFFSTKVRRTPGRRGPKNFFDLFISFFVIKIVIFLYTIWREVFKIIYYLQLLSNGLFTKRIRLASLARVVMTGKSTRLLGRCKLGKLAKSDAALTCEKRAFKTLARTSLSSSDMSLVLSPPSSSPTALSTWESGSERAPPVLEGSSVELVSRDARGAEGTAAASTNSCSGGGNPFQWG